MKKVQRLFEIDPWKIRTTKLDKENRRLQESLTSIGMGIWGCAGISRKATQEIIIKEPI